jgi:hypothetical protein
LTAEQLKLTPGEKERLENSRRNGSVDSVFLASFIGIPPRFTDFERAYGNEPWNGFVRANTFLYDIPHGEFVDRLDVELVVEVNRLIHVPDRGARARLLRTTAMVMRGGQWDRAGELRDGRAFARPERYTPTEIANLLEVGIRVRQLTGGLAMLEYPRPSLIRATLPTLVEQARSVVLAGAEPIGAAAEFQRRLVALHPFGDSNGRTSRILMNRLLAEFDLPPAILADQNRDISLGAEAWRTEVARGIARSKAFLRLG